MLFDDLKSIVQEGRNKNLPLAYIKVRLKEALIYYALNFIYNSPKWNKLIFNGGTALKVIWQTARLSEDLDLDSLRGKFNSKEFCFDLIKYSKQRGLDEVTYSLKGSGKIIILKFPILKELGIIKNTKSESNWIYLKIEIEKNKYSSYKTIAVPITKYNLFFVVKSYSIETLFANKIGAILGRKNKVFQDRYDFKGRDFYDLIWFLRTGVKPNLSRLKQIIKVEQGEKIKNYDDVWNLVRERIKNINLKGIYSDMKNLIESPEGVKQLTDNYLDIYEKLIKNI